MHQHRSIPPRQGLYDPAHEHDACGVGFVVNIKGERSHDIVQKGTRGARQPDPSRRLRMRSADRRRRRHPDADSARVSRARGGEARLHAAGAGRVRRRPWFSCRSTGASARRPRRSSSGSCARKGSGCSDGARCRSSTSACGDIARLGLPAMRQVFIGRGEANRGRGGARAQALRHPQAREPMRALRCSLERRRAVLRLQPLGRDRRLQGPADLDPDSASSIPTFAIPQVKTALAMVHQRFSTNTFPSWDRAHPYRFLAHNGEINTLRGNVNWMRARGRDCSPRRCSATTSRSCCRSSSADGSDSAMFDNCLELLVRTGRSLPHAVMMMIPEAWQNDELMSAGKRAFYEYHACLMEPWDGPASIAFTDGASYRRGARSQRPASVALLRDQGRPGRDGVGSRRARHPARAASSARAACSRAACSWSTRTRAASSTTRRSRPAMAARKPYRQWLDENLSDLDRLPEPPQRAGDLELSRPRTCSGSSRRSATRSKI